MADDVKDPKDRPEATSLAETFHRHDDPPAGAEEQRAVTGRPNDIPLRVEEPAFPNSTFGSRAKRPAEPEAKAVDAGEAENKAVGPGRSTRKGR